MWPKGFWAAHFWPAHFWPGAAVAVGTGGGYWPRGFWPNSFWPRSFWPGALKASIPLPPPLFFGVSPALRMSP